MQALSREWGFDFYSVDKGIVTESDAEVVVREIEDKGVDLLLMHNTAFPNGKAVQALCRLNAYIGLWAVPEPTKEGPLPLNSFCGINMSGSIITEYLKEYDIPYKWFYGNANDDFFRERFKVTVKALTAVKNLKRSRIALIGGIADGFDDLYFDERKLQKKLGIRLYRNHEFSEIKDKALSYDINDVKDIMSQIQADASSVHPMATSSLEKNARLYKALADFKDQYGYDGLAISCWPKFRTEMGMVACAAIGRLNDQGIVAACEGDVYGLIGMMLLRLLSDSPSLVLDLSDIDESDETILLWHCGIGGKRMAKDGRIWLSPHSNPSNFPDRGKVMMSPVAEMEFKPGDATVVRIVDDGQRMAVLSGRFIENDKKSFDGSRGWLGDLKWNGEPISVKDLVNTIMVQGMPHHYPLTMGCFADEMLEIAGWLDMKPIDKIPYKNYFQRGYRN
jgi:L-fucose isomerase-like protein